MAKNITMEETPTLTRVFVNSKQKGILLEEEYGWRAIRSSGFSKYFEDKDLAAGWIAQRVVKE